MELSEFVQRGWRGELLTRQLARAPGDSGGDLVKREAGGKLNHERRKGQWTQVLASERSMETG